MMTFMTRETMFIGIEDTNNNEDVLVNIEQIMWISKKRKIIYFINGQYVNTTEQSIKQIIDVISKRNIISIRK